MTPQTRLRALALRHPACLQVLTKHGWPGCEGPEGPDETIACFASAHGLDAGQLIGELETAIWSRGAQPDRGAGANPRLPVVGAPPSERADPYSIAPFALLSLAATLSAGTLLGAVNLFKLHIMFLGVPAEVKRLHAFFQIVGLMACFIAGVATHVAPKFWGVRQASRGFLRLLWVSLACALMLRLSALWGAFALPLLLASGVASVAAGTLFAGWIVRARRTSMRPLLTMDLLLVAGALWWPAGAALWLAGEWPRGQDVLLPRGVEAGQETLLWGFVLFWFIGMSARVTPYFGSLMQPRARFGQAISALLCAGVTARALSSCLPGGSVSRSAGELLLALAFLAFVATARLPGKLKWRSVQGALDTSMLASVAWLAAGALPYLADAVRGLAGAGPVHALILDGARHSITVGFALGLLMALSSRLVPAFFGRPLPHPRLAVAALAMLHFGVLGRWAQALATVVGPAPLAVSGLSGLVQLAAILLWALNLMGTVGVVELLTGAGHAKAPAVPGELSAQSRVLSG